jgi:site-specific recombinase XerD
MKHKFLIRKDVSVDGNSPVYLFLTGGGKRERIHTQVYVPAKLWDIKRQRIKALNKQHEGLNLILDSYEEKIHKIKIEYHLSEKVLTPSLLRQDIEGNLSRINFCAFFEKMLKLEKGKLKAGSLNRHKSVLTKLRNFCDPISFTEINSQFMGRYHHYLAGIGNRSTTINANFASIKKFLMLAKEHGIKMGIEPEEIKIGSTKGNRTFLNERELKLLWDYFHSPFVNDKNKLIIGYFLFACNTGLRISDVQKIERSMIRDHELNFVATKTDKHQIITLNESALKLVKSCDDLFEKKLTDQFMNRELKIISRSLGIRKSVSFHVSRHTFATCFLRAGGKVEMLQRLLGHSTINQTMEYVHILNQEANKEIMLLDKLFQ